MSSKAISDRPIAFTAMMAALVMAELTCSLESGMIYVALSPLYETYGDPMTVGWLLTAFTLTAAASAAIAGRLGDLFGRRRVMLIMLLLAFSGSVLSATSSDLAWIIAGRAIQGISMAILPLGFGILRETVDRRHLGLGVSIIGTTYTVGGGIGVLVGGFVVDNFNWQTLFVVSAGMALVSVAMVLLFVPNTPAKPSSRGLDIVGGVLFAPAVALMLYGIAEGSGRGWTWNLAGIAVAGAAIFGLWFFYEWRRPNPLIDVRLLGKREVGLANLNIFIISLGPLLGPALVLPLLQQPVWTGVGFGLAATAAAFVKLPANAVSALADITAGMLTRKVTVRAIMIPAAVASAIGWFGLALFHDNLFVVATFLILFTVPSGSLLLIMTPQIILQSVPEDRTSEATGLTSVVRAFGKAIGVQIIAISFAMDQVLTRDGSGSFPGESGYVMAYSIAGILSLISLGLMFALPRGGALGGASAASQISPDEGGSGLAPVVLQAATATPAGRDVHRRPAEQ
jgi:MFS family permease